MLIKHLAALHLSLPLLKGGDIAQINSAGLPNILGDSGGIYLSQYTSGGTGALTKYKSSSGLGSAESPINMVGIQFDASLSNPIYGNATTVQPPSLLQIPQIKI